MVNLDTDEIVAEIFKCEFKDIQPIKDSEDNVYICMTEKTYNYIMEYKNLYNYMNFAFNRNLLNELNNDLDRLDYSEPLIEKWKVREMLKERLEIKNESR
jgi:hypothetical protein